MPILRLAWNSLINRRLTAMLTLLSIALSVTLLIGAGQGVGEALPRLHTHPFDTDQQRYAERDR